MFFNIVDIHDTLLYFHIFSWAGLKHIFLFLISNDWEFHEGGDFPSLDGGQQNDLEYTEFSVLPHRKNSFTGLVSGGTIERGKVKRKQKEIVESITKLSSYTDVKKENLYFVRQPPPITNAIQGNQVTFQCQIRGQKPIGKSKWDARDGWLFCLMNF